MRQCWKATMREGIMWMQERVAQTHIEVREEQRREVGHPDLAGAVTPGHAASDRTCKA
jgi:hypothetical protein